MAYKAIVDFKDLQTGHTYKAGDSYPYSGRANKDRVKQLITPTSMRGPLIKEVSAEKKKSNKAKEEKED